MACARSCSSTRRFRGGECLGFIAVDVGDALLDDAGVHVLDDDDDDDGTHPFPALWEGLYALVRMVANR